MPLQASTTMQAANGPTMCELLGRPWVLNASGGGSSPLYAHHMPWGALDLLNSRRSDAYEADLQSYVLTPNSGGRNSWRVTFSMAVSGRRAGS
jgi:hypothetical protein